jgi:hypothetical protein
MNEIQELDSYFQEFEDSLEEIKVTYEYENFTKSCQRVVDKAIVKYRDYAQEEIIRFHEKGDLFEMNLLMEVFSETLDKCILDAKVKDSIYRATIYQMNDCSEIDSTLTTSKDFKLFIKNK